MTPIVLLTCAVRFQSESCQRQLFRTYEYEYSTCTTTVPVGTVYSTHSRQWSFPADAVKQTDNRWTTSRTSEQCSIMRHLLVFVRTVHLLYVYVYDQKRENHKSQITHHHLLVFLRFDFAIYGRWTAAPHHSRLCCPFGSGYLRFTWASLCIPYNKQHHRQSHAFRVPVNAFDRWFPLPNQ